MDRREFLKATFAASAVTVALSESVSMPVVVKRRIEETADGPLPQMVAQQREVLRVTGEGTTDLSAIAQHLLIAVSHRLDFHDFVSTLSESMDRHVSESEGQGVGHTVFAYEPGVERFTGAERVVLSHQISALWEVPRRFTGSRREFYDLQTDRMNNGPEIEAVPIVLTQLDPIARYLSDQIVENRVNVFSPSLYMPKMSGSVEGAVGFASRTYGLAIRVVRCIGPEHELMMRADLLGGTFPSSVNRG